MSEIAKVEPRRSVITALANRYDMDPKNFEQVVRATCMPSATTNEEFAAFALICHEYGLNPILREIYAFPKKGGGIQPVVSLDGWVNLINNRSELDGIEFETHSRQGNLEAITCKIFRKDRSHPVEVTEYLSENFRNTEPWRMPHRMLRHRALIQCARYAFGFSGLADEDEAQRHASNPPPPAPTPALKAPHERGEGAPANQPAHAGAPVSFSADDFLSTISDELSYALTVDDVAELDIRHQESLLLLGREALAQYNRMIETTTKRLEQDALEEQADAENAIDVSDESMVVDEPSPALTSSQAPESASDYAKGVRAMADTCTSQDEAVALANYWQATIPDRDGYGDALPISERRALGKLVRDLRDKWTAP